MEYRELTPEEEATVEATLRLAQDKLFEIRYHMKKLGAFGKDISVRGISVRDDVIVVRAYLRGADVILSDILDVPTDTPI